MSQEAMKLWKATFDRDLLPKSVTTDARALLLFLAVLAREGTGYTDGYRPLARALGISTKSVTNRLTKLEQAGLIALGHAPTGPGMNRTIRLRFPTDLEGNAGSPLPPIALEQRKPTTETQEAHVPNGRSPRPERWKPASNYQEQSLQEDKRPRAALEAIRQTLPADLQRRLSSSPKLLEQLKAALDTGWTLEAISSELANRPWASTAPDRVSWEVFNQVEALANSKPPAPPRPAHRCSQADCVNGLVTVEDDNGRPTAKRCPEWNAA